MGRSDNLGNLEEVVMIAIGNLGSNAYGATIHEELEHVNRRISIGSLYITLNRMEEKGYIESRQGEATPERGGRAKRYYKILGNGLRALADAERARNELRMRGVVWNT